MPFRKGEPSCRKLEPTPQQRRQVLTMTGFGIRQSEIAAVLGIDEKTLRLHFRHELDTGATEANLRVASSLFHMATKEHNVAAAIWWTKARMGWKETTVNEQAGEQHFTFQHLVAARQVLIEITKERAIEGSVVASDSSGGAASPSNAPKPPIDLMEPALE